MPREKKGLCYITQSAGKPVQSGAGQGRDQPPTPSVRGPLDSPEEED